MNLQRERDVTAILKIIKFLLFSLLIVGGLYLSCRVFKYLLPLFFGMLLAETAVFIGAKLRQLPFLTKSRLPKTEKRRDGDILALLIYFVLVASLISLIIWGVTAGVGSFIAFARSLPASIGSINFNELLGKLFQSVGGSQLSTALEEAALFISQQITRGVPVAITRILNSTAAVFNAMPLITLVVMISVMFGYYSINGSRKIYATALKMTGNRALVRNLFKLLSQVINTIFRIVGGYVLLLLVTFGEAYLGFALIRLPNAWIWALICSFVDMLPVLGISAVMIPIIIYLFVTGSSVQAVGVIVLLIVMTIARRMWESLILGSAMRLHPLSTILSMIVGIMIWGLGGVLLGPLYFVTLRQFLEAFQISDFLRKYLAEQHFNYKEEPR